MFLYVAPAPQSSFAIEQKQIKVRAGRVQLGVWALHKMPMHIVQMLVFRCALALGSSQDTHVSSEAAKAQFLSSGSPRA